MAANSQAASEELQITAPVSAAYAEILTPEAVHFVASLAAKFEGRRQEILARRQERQGEGCAYAGSTKR